MNMLTAKEISLIQKSWALISKTDTFIIGDIFYNKLFYDNPELRKLFPKNIEEQYGKFTDMLNTIIERLEKLDDMKGDIIEMARRHVKYGVKSGHYNIVGKALLSTLQKAMGKEWTDEIRSAWINCYAILSGTMIAATAK